MRAIADDLSARFVLPTDNPLVANLAQGGDASGGAAGAGQGGAIYEGIASNTLTLSGDNILANAARGGNGLSGGNGEGGGLWVAGIVSIADSSLVGDIAQGGSTGQGLGGGVFLASGSQYSANTRTIFLGNHASTSGNDRYSA